MTSVETPLDVVKRFTSNFEKKQRNLYKRKSKLDQYREKLNRGESLNEEQKKAVEGYDAVIQSIAIVHEALSQSKDLADEVSKASNNMEVQRQASQESSIVSHLCVHNNLMQFLDSLSSPLVRSAVLKASSENQLKMLDIVHDLVKSPVICDWSGSAASIPLLQEHPDLLESAQHGYNFVSGRQLPIPLPSNYDGPHKKFNFKEARSLCFRLLSTPNVMRSLESEVRTSGSSVCDESPHPVNENASSGLGVSDAPSFVEEPLETGQPIVCSPIPDPVSMSQPNEVLDEVIKPLGGAFKFLQASSVLPPVNQMEMHSTHMVPSEFPSAATAYQKSKDSMDEIRSYKRDEEDEVVVDDDEPETTAPNQAPLLVSYSCPQQDIPKYHPPHDAHAQPVMQQTHITNEHQSEETNDYVIVEASRQSKPMSYAELLRRPWGQQQQHSRHEQTAKRQMVHNDNMLSHSTDQVIQKQPPKLSHHVQQQTMIEKNQERELLSNNPLPRGRGGRGFRPPFSRGGRRPMGHFRGSRVGGGPGPGTYRDMQPGVAQPSY